MSEHQNNPARALTDLLDQTIQLLGREKESGQTTLELDPAVVRALGDAVRGKPAPPPVPKRAPAPVPAQIPAEPAASVSERKEPYATRPPAARPPAKAEKTVAASAAVVINSAPLPDSLEELAARINSCRQCPLHQWRTNAVPGTGCSTPDILFIGEGPGKDEDAQGIPFVGRAGELLTRLIIKMGYTRETVFIGNIVKCRPTVDNEGTRDRPPEPEEMAGCLPYLKKQIALLKPKVIVLLGNTAMQGLFGYKGITKYRGKWLVYEGIDTMPTYHPSYLLRNGGGNSKPFWEVWEDMTAVLQKLGKGVPQPGREKPVQQSLI